MDIAARVRTKSDRRARGLILALCLAPLATPLLIAGANMLLKPASVPAPAAAPQPLATPQPLALRASLDENVFSPRPMMPPRMEQPAAPAAQPIARAARASESHVFREVRIVDGLKIAAGDMVVALRGIGPTPPGAECRRLDGVVEPCAQRAANRLEVLTRGRPVVCELQAAMAGEARGVCRAGKIDLADDLVRNGLAVRTSDRP